MKFFIGGIFFVVLTAFLLSLHACAVAPPLLSSAPTPTSTPFTGTIVVNDVCVGACPVRVWLDGIGPVTVTAGTVHTYSNITPGPHTLTFVSTTITSCGSGSVTCGFTYYSGPTNNFVTNFTLASNQVDTAVISDDGCSQMTVSTP